MMTVLFYAAAAVAVVSSLLVITRRSAVHALLYLVNSLLAVALIFFLLGAPFAAALEIIVYAGAIMVLFIFVVMVFDLGERRTNGRGRRRSLRTWLGPAALSAVLLAEFVAVLLSPGKEVLRPAWIPPRAVGASLFSTYALGVELASMLLLSAAVAAFHLGRRIETEDRPSSAAPAEGEGP